MGCCEKEKCCDSKSEPKRKIPWFALMLLGLAVLVVANWQ